MADSFAERATAAIRWSVSSIACGPWLQLAPIERHAERLELADDVLGRVAVEGVAFLVEGQAHRDGQLARRASGRPASAAFAWSSDGIVSSRNRSTPPSSSPSACSR